MSGSANSTKGAGVDGYASGTTGNACGVFGRTESADGPGVVGVSSAANGTGVYGFAGATAAIPMVAQGATGSNFSLRIFLEWETSRISGAKANDN